MPSSNRLLSLVAFLLLAAGCAREEREEGTAGGGAGTSAEASGADGAGAPAAEPARPVDPEATGAIVGTVRFDGEPPERRPLAMGTEPACSHDQPPLSRKVVVSDEGGLADVLVHLPDGAERWLAPDPPAEPAVLDQEGCLYVPHVLALRAGRPLHVENSDPTTHNVNLRAPRNGASMNRIQGRGSDPIELVFERRELSIQVGCDIHPWMSAWVHVLEHPWFDVSGPDGAFRIEGVPAGTHRVEALHPVLGRVRAEAVVEAGGTATAELAFGP